MGCPTRDQRMSFLDGSSGKIAGKLRERALAFAGSGCVLRQVGWIGGRGFGGWWGFRLAEVRLITGDVIDGFLSGCTGVNDQSVIALERIHPVPDVGGA